MSPPLKILLAGPEAKLRRLIAAGLVADADQTALVSRAGELAALAGWPDMQVALLDWDALPEPSTFLVKLREFREDLPVVALTASADTAAVARDAGVCEALLKPVDVDACRRSLRRLALPARASVESSDEIRFVTQSAAMEAVLSIAWRVAPTPASVLILGENGTGKTLLARAIHARSLRKTRPFVVVNCPCLQPQLLESELFGHVRGSFTGAVSDTLGKVAVAEGGTLFLDEVGELPGEVQAKLLRLLQERSYERVGETGTYRADIRVLAATNRDLRQQVTGGLFREDLFYRLNVITIEMPPLRSRPEDIIPTAQYFLDEIGRTVGVPARQLSLPARELLAGHAWPGNLRELRNVIERTAILCDRPMLDACDFTELTGRSESAAPQVGEFVTLEAIIEAHIRRVTARAQSYEQAARILGIDKSTLYRWRKRVDTLEPGTVAEYAG